MEKDKNSAAYVRENWSQQTAHILRIAEEVCEGIFLFDLPWDMERTCEPVVFKDEIDWEYIPGEDPEFIYQMNRHRYFICLGQAYVLTGNEKYAERFIHIFMDWVKRAALSQESRQTTWRTIEAGLRGLYWTKAVSYFQGSPQMTDEVRETFLEALKVHGKYLAENFDGFKISSNWGVIESCGLYFIGTALERNEWCRTALERLALQAEVQILPDGVHWEQSAMYHNEVLTCYMEVLRLAWETAEEDRRLLSVLVESAEKMALADLAWKKPDHRQPLYGDSDDTDIRDMLTQTSWLMHLYGKEQIAGLLKYAAFPYMDFEGCWDFGTEAALAYASLSSIEPRRGLWPLLESGNLIWRSSWNEDADYLHFRNGLLGGGHGHSDKLHLSMIWDGEDVLVDAGRYRYVYDENRVWFKSAYAHNTILADEKDHLDYKDAWAVENAMPEVRLQPQEQGGMVLLEGSHLGYMQQGKDIYMNRKVLLLGEGLYLILDMAIAGAEHTYQRLFHFREGIELLEEENTVFFRGKKTKGRMWTDSHASRKIITGKISRHYNEYTSALCLQTENRQKGIAVMASLFSKGEETIFVEERQVRSAVPNLILDSSDAMAWHIKKGERHVDVILRLKDVGGKVVLLESGGCMGIGRVMAAWENEKSRVFF